MEGTIDVTGKSYVPTVAYIFVHLIQVQVHSDETFTAIANNPEAKAADANGSQQNVSGNGDLHIIPETKEISTDCALCYIPN